jgi:hypothetical protein
VWGPGFLDSRLKWRSQQPITLLELRTYTLAQPLVVPARDDYWGCFSWVTLEAQPRQAGGVGELLGRPGGLRPALGDAEFAERQRLLRAGLQALQGVEELQLPQRV